MWLYLLSWGCYTVMDVKRLPPPSPPYKLFLRLDELIPDYLSAFRGEEYIIAD